MTEEQGARRLERFAEDLPRAAEAGLTEALKVVKERAVWWSSGALSPADLRRMDHPYARAERGQARPDPGRINIGKRRAVVEGWTAAPVERTGGTVRVSLYNTAPEARFLDGGTRLMVDRPLPARVLDELEGRGTALAALEAAIGEAMR